MALKGGKQIGAGRPPGAKNRVTKIVRESLGELFTDSLPKIHSALAELEINPEKYITAWSKLLPYFSPRLQTISIEDKTTLEQFVAMEPDERAQLVAELKKQAK